MRVPLSIYRGILKPIFNHHPCQALAKSVFSSFDVEDSGMISLEHFLCGLAVLKVSSLHDLDDLNLHPSTLNITVEIFSSPLETR